DRNLLFESRKARRRDGEFIFPGSEIRNHVKASVVAGGGTRNTCCHVLRRYVRIRNDGPGCVENRACYLAGLRLGVNEGSQQSQNDQEEEALRPRQIKHFQPNSSEIDRNVPLQTGGQNRNTAI